MTASISDTLLAWYDVHARELPWRVAPGAGPAAGPPDPYRVWLSEVMLQQTTVAAVKPYFEKFTQTWPTLEALAAAPEDAVMAAWAGLGYYSRARNLVACARKVAAEGGFPHTEAQLRKLPGLGAYTAAAIAAIAFGQRAVVVDANVERVVARLSAIADPLPRARKVIREHADAITPDRRAGDFAQAMMDLGATICTARDPRCLLCPLSASCAARKAGDPARYPVKAPRKSRPLRKGCAWWIGKTGTEGAGHVWLVRRPSGGMLGGMRVLPSDDWSAKGDGNGELPFVGKWRNAGTVRHGFTHFELELTVMVHGGNELAPPGEGEWWAIERLADAGLPTVFARAAQRVLAAG